MNCRAPPPSIIMVTAKVIQVAAEVIMGRANEVAQNMGGADEVAHFMGSADEVAKVWSRSRRRGRGRRGRGGR